MKSLKSIFAFLVPLLSMLITFCIFLIIDNIVDNYKSKISKDYSIVVVAISELDKNTLNELAGIKIQNIELLSNDKIIDNIKTNLSANSIELLRQKLPYFYQIYLETFPTSADLEIIKQTLLSNKDIKTVEVFYKNHNQVYLLLLILNRISFILFFIITIFAIIIIAKQIKLWFHEHHVKVSILKLHGASMLYSASSVLKYALISSFLAFLIADAFLIYICQNIDLLFPLELQDIIDIKIDIAQEMIKIFILSFSISIFTIFGVLLKYKISND